MADLQREMAENSRNAAERAREADEWAREHAEEQDEEARQRHDDLVELRKQEIYKRTNPGIYKCPFCLNITLNREASRCPICHGDIPAGFWPPILEAETKRKEEEARRRAAAAEAEALRKAAAAEEWAKGAPERERIAQAAAEARAAAEVAAEAARQEEVRRQASARLREKLVGALGAIALVVGGIAVVIYLINVGERYKRSGPMRIPDAPVVSIAKGSERVVEVPVGVWSEPYEVPVMPFQLAWATDGPVSAMTMHQSNSPNPSLTALEESVSGVSTLSGTPMTVRFTSRANTGVRMRLRVCRPPDCDRMPTP